MTQFLLMQWNQFVFWYYLLANGFNLLLMVAAFVYTQRYIKRSLLVDDKRLFRMPVFIKPISILAPAYNEELTVIENIHSLLNLNYPHFEVVLINDGSKDATLRQVVEGFGLEPHPRGYSEDLETQPIRAIYTSPRFPNLVVVDKVNGGKADALNAGLNVARYPIFMAIDADSILERGALLKMVRPYIENPETVAVGGVVRIVNGCQVRAGGVSQVRMPRKLVPLFQVVEYMRAFLFGRVGWQALNMTLVISGAMGLFKKSAVVAAGGYTTSTVGEDMELVVRLHHTMTRLGKPYRVEFLPDPVCWTEAPETLKVLSRQRRRWHRGLMECLAGHRQMMFNPRFGRVGLVALPYFLLVEALGPFVEIVGWVAFVATWYFFGLTTLFIVAFLCASILLGVVLSMAALILEELTFQRYPTLPMVAGFFIMAMVENFGYRQLTTWWRLVGTWEYLRGKHSWGEMTRVGFKRE